MNLPSFIWLILLPALFSATAYLMGRIIRRPSLWWLPYLIGTLGLAASWIPFVLTASEVLRGQAPGFQLGLIALRMDPLGLLLSALVLGLGTFVALYSGPYLSRETGQEKFYAMLLLMISMIIGLGCATDLFNLWIWFEAMAVTSYLLVAFYRQQPASLEAGFKYLVQNAAGSVLVVAGIGLVFASTGSLDLARIQAVASPAPLLLAAGALFVIGFGVKSALVPLHTWLPDAHSQAPSGISAMLSGVVIEAGLVAMLRAVGSLSPTGTTWASLLVGFGALNMLIGNLMALRQRQIKRLLAYSSVAQIGYILLGLGITFWSGQPGGAQGSLFHLFNHGLMKGLAFLAAGVLLYSLHIAAGDHGPLVTDDLAGAASRYPLAAIGLSIAVLALGGLPPLAGFMSKWQIFVAGFETHNAALQWLVIFAALNSALSLAYYAPLVNAMYRLEPSVRVRSGARMPRVMAVPLVALGLMVVALGIWPGVMEGLTLPAARVLLIGLGN